MPVEASAGGAHDITYRGQSRAVAATGETPDPRRDDRVMLIRNRKSRIYFLRQFFDYPIQAQRRYAEAAGIAAHRENRRQLHQKHGEPAEARKDAGAVSHQSLRQRTVPDVFQIVHGKGLGRSLRQISAEWGAQRIKGLSISRAIRHFLKSRFAKKPAGDIAQKGPRLR